MSNNLLRILTALVGIPAVVGLLYLGGWPFALLVAVLALLSQYEVYHLLEAAGLAPRKSAGLVLGALLVLRVVQPWAMHAAVAVFVVAAALYPFDLRLTRERRSERAAAPGTLAATIFGAVYPSALLAYLIEIRIARGPSVDDTGAFLLTLTVFLLVWSTDTLAYYVGRSMGKRPLAPTISPKKTWAGAVGGALGAVGVAAVLKLTMIGFLPWVHVVAVAVLCAVVGQLGDLMESKLKRLVGVKDSGTLLPGHGGLLDRFDAMILVAPAVYLYLRFVAGILQPAL